MALFRCVVFLALTKAGVRRNDQEKHGNNGDLQINFWGVETLPSLPLPMVNIYQATFSLTVAVSCWNDLECPCLWWDIYQEKMGVNQNFLETVLKELKSKKITVKYLIFVIVLTVVWVWIYNRVVFVIRALCIICVCHAWCPHYGIWRVTLVLYMIIKIYNYFLFAFMAL